MIAAAWVQAIGSIIAILAAASIAIWQRHTSLRDARDEEKRQNEKNIRRLVAALGAELLAALAALERRAITIRGVLSKLDEVKRAGGEILQVGPAPPGAMTITDAVIYRQVAAEIGRLPSELVSSTVQFYSMAVEIGRIAEMAASIEVAYQALQGLIPRVRLHGEMLKYALDRFAGSNFDENCDLRVPPDTIKALAEKTGYPLSEIVRERGIEI